MGHVHEDESEEEISESQSDRLCEIEQVLIKEEVVTTDEEDDDENHSSQEDQLCQDDDVNCAEDLPGTSANSQKHKCTWNGCNWSFVKLNHLQRHMRSHTGEKPYKCTHDNCDKAYTTIFNLKKHRLTHGDFSFDLDEEVPEKKPKRVHRCTYEGCEASFSKRARFEGHIRQHKGERPFKCSVENCDKAYSSKAYLRRHVRSHTSVPTLLICDICSLPLSNRQNLIRHHKRVHTSNRLHCAECDQTFRKKSNFAAHMTVIHNGGSITCDRCPKKFKTEVLLNKHREIHDKSYTCDRPGCQKIFLKFIELRRHKQNEHVTEYKCPECEKTFLSRPQVRRHQKVHRTSLIPCPYDMCHKTYLYKKNLDMHIRSAHLNIKVYCDICKIGCTSKSILRRHIQNLHMGRVKTPRKKERAKRRDAGRAKQSMVSKLCGVTLQCEKELLQRSPRVQLTTDTFTSFTVTEN